MQLSEIKQQVRNLLSDGVGDSNFAYWRDAELIEYINGCVEQLCERTSCLVDSISDVACLITLVPGQRHYPLHASVLDVSRVQPSWGYTPLEQKSAGTANHDWLTTVGTPASYVLDYSNGMLSLTAAPVSSGLSLRLTVTRLPLVELAYAGDVPEIPKQYHRSLYDGVMELAYLKQDSETYNLSKSKLHGDRWESRLAEIVRRESRLKPRFTVARRVEMC